MQDCLELVIGELPLDQPIWESVRLVRPYQSMATHLHIMSLRKGQETVCIMEIIDIGSRMSVNKFQRDLRRYIIKFAAKHVFVLGIILECLGIYCCTNQKSVSLLS